MLVRDFQTETNIMLDQLINEDGDFKQHLRRVHAAANSQAAETTAMDTWMQYWDDTESVTGNLRKLEHWLQRARTQHN